MNLANFMQIKKYCLLDYAVFSLAFDLKEYHRFFFGTKLKLNYYYLFPRFSITFLFTLFKKTPKSYYYYILYLIYNKQHFTLKLRNILYDSINHITDHLIEKQRVAIKIFCKQLTVNWFPQVITN